MRPARIYKAGLHFGEEPIVRGNDRSGMVLFSGCHLRCSFCYTPEVAFQNNGIDADDAGFRNILRRLVECGAKNVNFISPTHVWESVEAATTDFSKENPEIPVVLKISGYESAAMVSRMARVAAVLVPDLKVISEKAALSVSLPRNYGTMALAAIRQMKSTHGDEVADSEGKLAKGMIVRHLMLPHAPEETDSVIEALGGEGYRGYLNLMTNFVDPAQKRLIKAGSARVEEVTRRAESLGMKVLVDAKRQPRRSHVTG